MTTIEKNQTILSDNLESVLNRPATVSWLGRTGVGEFIRLPNDDHKSYHFKPDAVFPGPGTYAVEHGKPADWLVPEAAFQSGDASMIVWPRLDEQRRVVGN